MRMLPLLCFILVPIVPISADLAPLSCSASPYSDCSAYLYIPNSSLLPPQLATLFNSTLNDVKLFQGSSTDYLISVNCSCYTFSQISAFFALATYTVQSIDSGFGLAQIAHERFNNFAWIGDNPSANIQQGQAIKIQLGCGCPPTGYSSVISYLVQSGDIAYTIATKFQSDINAMQELNNIQNISSIQANQVIFIPSTLAPIRSPSLSKSGVTKSKSRFLMVVVIVLLVVAIIFFLLVIWAYRVHLRKRSRQNSIAGHLPCLDVESSTPTQKGSSIAHTGKTGSSSKAFSFFMSLVRHGSSNNNVKNKISFPRVFTESTTIFEPENQVVFTYEEVVEATGNFLASRKLGEGAYGSVFLGSLRDKDVAIKQMKSSSSREFIAELKVLCKVHHSNLVELIGYAVSKDELYLVYEFVVNGALSDHLHRPQEKGYQPLSWTARVQIALDAARGLEYIHDHTKTHYIHRDIKTSNILLDGIFRAKVADFGLTKLIEHAGEGGGMTTRIVGTFGYLAPEYIQDGHVTSKSDVFAFGVVLMELITGQGALIKTKKSESESTDRRSLVSVISSLFQSGKMNVEMLKIYIDPNLEDQYPPHAVSKMAEIARLCVEEDPMSRPDMRDIVYNLSQILLASTEWEAALAGNSQIFSGLIQGR